MNVAFEANFLANYIKSINLPLNRHEGFQPYRHIGALFTNVILQAGLNYRTVVQPRVAKLMTEYPTADTLTGFESAIFNDGIETVIQWKHQDKIDRMTQLISFCKSKSVNTCIDLTLFLQEHSNRDELLEIKGIGPKTLDYLLKLLNFDTVAVDRHIYAFVQQSGLQVAGYQPTKKVVEFAADLLSVSRMSIDYSIWLYMSSKAANGQSNQLEMNF
ncbi:MAG TPA: hypothetical protein VK508_15755 [Cyclobacteriaceae bacterium]|nr:hypothetical protein [Cyclobacteriaceae bacterium]